MSNATQSHHAPGSAYEKDQVVQIIHSVLDKARKSNEASVSAIYKELQELHTIIEQARKDLHNSQAADINSKHIPTATDELDAIVEATAAATGAIMDSCEKVQDIAGQIGGDKGDAISAEITKIFESCSFQDITGQRITKVVKALKTIETKVDALVNAIGSGPVETSVSAGGRADDDDRTGDAALLNGPQLPGNAITQADIDKLLSEFD